ncbi:MAG: lipopolysaccharide heptosyltransferase II [Thermoguttaceae bacterium]|jgi:heptosyltransferase-2
MKLVLFLPNWLGDLVMATPALRAIRRHFGPAAHMVGILRPKLAQLLAGTDWLDEQWCFDPRSRHFSEGRLALIRRMRQARFDMAILLTHSLHTALLAWLGGATERVGYVRDGRGPLLTGKLYPPRNGFRLVPVPMVDAYLALAEAVGCAAESQKLELVVTEVERQLGETIWRSLGLRSDGRVIALNSNGAYGTGKVWPPHHCGRLARHIVEQLDHDVLILCGPGETDAARDIVAHAAAPRVFSLAGAPVGLPATKAALQRSRLLISTDSGPRHVAAALGKPVITLLGPTRPVWIENPTVTGPIVQLELDCIGCGKRACPLRHHRCMRDLSPETVFEEVVKLLDQREARAA